MSPPTDPTSGRIAITGSTGLIGRRLMTTLASGPYEVFPLVRRLPAPGTNEIHWHPQRSELDAAALESMDVVVHLAGENIAGGRWTAARKRAIHDSRCMGTSLLACCLACLKQPPRALITASAIGFYGDRRDELLTEDAPPGAGFLADVTRAWEAAAQPARDAGIRVVHLRLGVVLARNGGALARMLPPFRWGLGGRVGHGRQYLSWISLTDAVRAIEHAITRTDIEGPVNVVAPYPVTNAEFARVLGRLLRRPTVFPLPATVVSLLLGQMGRELLLSSTRVMPQRLAASGFTFEYEDLESALRAELGLPARNAQRE